MIAAIVRLLLGRLAQAVPVLLLVAGLAFLLTNVAGDPLAAALGPDATAAQRTAAAAQLGLDAPLPLRFARFVLDAVQGNFGVSARLGRPVGPLLLERLPASVELALIALLLALALGLPAGAFAAWRPRSRLARALVAGSALAVSLPTFLTGTLLILLFAATLRWLPSFGRGDVVQLGVWSTGLLTASGRRALILPAVTLAAFQAAVLLRLVRAGMAEALASQHVRFARARGLPERAILRQALRHALVPAIASAGVQLGLMLAFSVVTETVFQWPGLGLLLTQSVASADVPVMTAYLLLVAVLFGALNLLADVLAMAVDPRLRPAPRMAPAE
jgi:peptide/nickel transport system permease protein